MRIVNYQPHPIDFLFQLPHPTACMVYNGIRYTWFPQGALWTGSFFFRDMLWCIYRNILDITIVYNSVILYNLFWIVNWIPKLKTIIIQYPMRSHMNLRIPSSSFSHRNDDLKELGRGSQGVAKLAKDAAGREFCVRPPSHGHWNDLKMARSAEFRVQHQTYLVGGLEHVFFPYLGNSNPNWRTHIFQRGGEKPPTRYGWKMLNPQKPLNWCDFSNENCALTSTIWGWCAWRLNYVEASGTRNQPSARSGQHTLRLVIQKNTWHGMEMPYAHLIPPLTPGSLLQLTSSLELFKGSMLKTPWRATKKSLVSAFPEPFWGEVPQERLVSLACLVNRCYWLGMKLDLWWLIQLVTPRLVAH